MTSQRATVAAIRERHEQVAQWQAEGRIAMHIQAGYVAAAHADRAALLQRVEEMGMALEDYGWHSEGCKYVDTALKVDCDCGFLAAISEGES